MVSTKTTAGRKTVETSATNLDLTVTNQAEYKGLVEATRKSIQRTADGFSSERSDLSERTRKALYKDLGAVLAVAEVLLHEDNEEYYLDLLDEHDIPAVLDPTTRNEYLPIARLLWGYWPKSTTKNPNPAFAWSRSVELYAKVLRGAVVRGIKPKDLAATLTKENGFKKFKEEDDKKYRKTDADVIAMDQIIRDVITDVPKGSVPAGEIGVTDDEKSKGLLISLLGRVCEDGSVEVIQRLAASQDALKAAILKIPAQRISDIRVAKCLRRN